MIIFVMTVYEFVLCANFGVVDEFCESCGGRAAVDGGDGPEVVETGLDVAERRSSSSSLHDDVCRCPGTAYAGLRGSSTRCSCVQAIDMPNRHAYILSQPL